MGLRSATLVALLALSASTGLGQDRPESGTGRFVKWAINDPSRLIVHADGTDLAMGAGALLALVPLSLLDDLVNRRISEGEGLAAGPMLKGANGLGSISGIVASLAVFAISLSTDDLRLQDTAFTSLQAAGYAGSLTLGLKFALGRKRPAESDGPFRFRPLSSFDDSWPSGHSAVAFALVTPWVQSYSRSPAWVLLAASGATGVARLVYGKHLLTDVLGGASLGAANGLALGRRHGLSRHR